MTDAELSACQPREDLDLVLLTNNFPNPTGDSVFVANEIDELAASFRHVYIFSMMPPTSTWTPRLPPNVTYVGGIIGGGGWRSTLSAMRFRHVLPTVRFVAREFISRGRVPKPGRLLRAAVVCVVGGGQVRTFLGTRSTAVTTCVYSFWGADCGYLLAAEPPLGDIRVVRMHGYDLYEERVQYLPFRERILHHSDLVALISEDGLAYLQGCYGDSGVDGKLQIHRLGTVDHGVGPWERPSEIVRVVSCSALIPLKRVDLIFRTLKVLSVRFPVEWVHFGDGPDRGLLEDLILREGVRGLSVSLRGHVSNLEVVRYFMDTPVDVFVNLSSTEGVPVSIMEAMSFGVPVVATDVGGTGEIVSRLLGSGELVAPDSSVEVFARIIGEVVVNRMTYDPRFVWLDRCTSEGNVRHLISSIRGVRTLACEGGGASGHGARL